MLQVVAGIYSVVALIWLVGWAILSIVQLSRRRAASVFWIILIHVVFCGVPLLLDIAFGKPEFLTYPGFRAASRDPLTEIVYAIYVSVVPLVLFAVGRSPRYVAAPPESIDLLASSIERFLRRVWPALFVVLVLPLVLAIASPNPAIYLNYAVSVTQDLTPAESAFHTFVALSARLSLVAGAGLLLITKPIKLYHLVMIVPFVALSVWLDGKRSIVALAIVLIGFVLWQKGFLRGVRLLIAGFAIILLMGIYSALYAENVRQWDDSRLYELARIDYGRDSQIKMTLYAELNPDEMQILNYRGESIVFYGGMFIPRAAWPEKPLPYAQMFTSALYYAEPRLWGWSMTTSWLEEAIANLSWFGTVVGPLVPALICRWSDDRRSDLIKALGILVAALTMAVHLSAFAPIAIIWLILICVGERYPEVVRNRKKRRAKMKGTWRIRPSANAS
jgi:hypothetical protein